MKLIALLIFALLTNLTTLYAQNVGVGTDNPAEFFSVGANSPFRVNANGNLVRINDVQYNFPSVQATSGSVLANDGSGNLSWTKVTTGNISATGTANNTTFLRGDGSWQTPAGGGGITTLSGSVAFSFSASGNFFETYDITTGDAANALTTDFVHVTSSFTITGQNERFIAYGFVPSNGTVRIIIWRVAIANSFNGTLFFKIIR
jgi:hypothetical protein